MAYGYSSVPAGDRTAAAADKPMILGSNYLRTISTAPQWRQGGSWAAGTDETDSDGPTYFAYDNLDKYKTYPDSSAHSTWYLIFDFGATGITFDSVALLNVENMTGVTIKVQIDDLNTYAGAVDLATTTRTDDKRIVLLDMDGHSVGVEQRYTAVRYARFEFTKVSNFLPKIGEIIFSRRYQLERKPNTPSWDGLNLISNVKHFVSESGSHTSYTYFKNQRQINVDINPDNTTYIGYHETFWVDDIDGGTLPFLWIDDPATYPETAYWMYVPKAELIGPLRNPSMRMFNFNALEHGPNFYQNETG